MLRRLIFRTMEALKPLSPQAQTHFLCSVGFLGAVIYPGRVLLGPGPFGVPLVLGLRCSRAFRPLERAESLQVFVSVEGLRVSSGVFSPFKSCKGFGVSRF